MISISWQNYDLHRHIEFENLRSSGCLVDVTFVCENRKIGAHKFILYSSSQFFKELLEGHNCTHPIIFMNEMSYSILEALIQYLYTGQVDIPQESLQDFLKAAKKLSIKGVGDQASSGRTQAQNELINTADIKQEVEDMNDEEDDLESTDLEPQDNHGTSLKRRRVNVDLPECSSAPRRDSNGKISIFAPDAEDRMPTTNQWHQLPLIASKEDVDQFDLQRVIQAYPLGNYVFNCFQAQGRLDDKARKVVVDSVVAWHLQKGIRMSRPEFERISEEISILFNESSLIYYKKIQKGKNPSGRLYDRYFNCLKRMRKMGLANQLNTMNYDRTGMVSSDTASNGHQWNRMY